MRRRLILYIGFTLSIFAMLTVLGAFVLRVRRPDAARPYRATLWPVTPLLFVALSGWLMVQGVRMQPRECLLYGGGTLRSSALVYLLCKRLARRPG